MLLGKWTVRQLLRHYSSVHSCSNTSWIPNITNHLWRGIRQKSQTIRRLIYIFRMIKLWITDIASQFHFNINNVARLWNYDCYAYTIRTPKFIASHDLECEHDIITRDTNSFSWAKIWEFLKAQCDLIDDLFLQSKPWIPGWWEIDIHGFYSLVKIAFMPICEC